MDVRLAPSKPIAPALLVDQVFETLRERIARGELAPGQQLRIREVASSLGTSEMPVREAVRRLAQAGLLSAEPYRGATVRMLTIEDLEHIYDVRIMLEPEAGRQGAIRADEAVVEVMRRHWSLLQTAADQGDVAESVSQDEQLLTALYAAGRNDVLAGLVSGLWDGCRPYRNLWAHNAVAQGVAAWDHIPALIDAVARRDAEEVFGVLHRTYQDARSVVRRLLDNQEGVHR